MCVCDLMALGGRDRRMPKSSLALDLSGVFAVVDKRPFFFKKSILVGVIINTDRQTHKVYRKAN